MFILGSLQRCCCTRFSIAAVGELPHQSVALMAASVSALICSGIILVDFVPDDMDPSVLCRSVGRVIIEIIGSLELCVVD